MTTAFKVERRGRKRKDGVIRDKSGKSRGERPGIHPETLAIRNREIEALGIPLTEMHREGNRIVEKPTASNRLTGFTLGLLYLRGKNRPKDPGSIDETQYLAGEAFSRIMHRYLSLRGMAKGVQSPSFIMVGAGAINAGRDEAEMTDEQRDEFQRDYDRSAADFRKCHKALAKAAREHGFPVMTVTWRVCMENASVGTLTPADYGYLRCGLNALGRVV